MMAVVGLVWGCAVERQGAAKYSGGLAEKEPIPWGVNFGKFYGKELASTYLQALYNQVDFWGNPRKHRIGDPSTEVYLEFDLSGDAPRLNVKTDKSKKDCDQIPSEKFKFYQDKDIPEFYPGADGQKYMNGRWLAIWKNDKNQTFKIILENGRSSLVARIEVHYEVVNKKTGKTMEVFDYIAAVLNPDGRYEANDIKKKFGSGSNCGGSPSDEPTDIP